MRARILVLLAVAGCGGGGQPGVVDGGVAADAGAPDAAWGPAPVVRIGTWNLKNFSDFGTEEFRIPDIAARIDELDLDLIALQELKPGEDIPIGDPQAFDALLDALPTMDGVHYAWRDFDTSVGLAYDPATVELVSWDALFTQDNWAFPRPPLRARVRVHKDGRSIELVLIVLHLKAFGDSLDRRRLACERLDELMRHSPDRYVVLGDLNDSPHDAPADNAFTATFLDAEPDYYFVTASLPPETVSSTGWYHYVDGVAITGEFLDHVIVTDLVARRFDMLPTVHAVPEAQFDAYEDQYSDHFPVVVELKP